MQVLRQLPPIEDPDVLVGLKTMDDAAVYRLSDELALVQSVDFFPPVVNDPYSFGSIAAANALSDIYAMGACPLIAMNIVCFPAKGVPKSVLVEILKGGAAKAREAGVSIVGGHTIDDKEIKYGLAVTGVITTGKQVTNATAQPGDVLILTKPLGIGIITTAIKADFVGQETIDRAVEVMTTLNKAASEVMVSIGVNACTDITGFGLLGHLQEMAEASKVGAVVFLSSAPVIPEAWDLVARGAVPGGTYRNLRFFSDSLIWKPKVSEDAKLILCDAQTSGGLLIAVPREKSQEFLASLRSSGVLEAASIGEIVKDEGHKIQVMA